MSAPFSAGEQPVGIVSGSGINLRPILDHVLGDQSFEEAIGVSGKGIAGHDGVFIFGHAAGVPVVLQSGRIHLYEGYPVGHVAATVDALHRFGVRRVIFTNAVGGLAHDLAPGALVAANRVVPWRYGAHAFPTEMVPDFEVPGCDAAGTYFWMHGPCYETRAEIEALCRLGGLTVGMSLPVELERCRALGMACGVVSCVTNNCIRHESALTHTEVVETAQRASNRLARLLRDYLARDL